MPNLCVCVSFCHMFAIMSLTRNLYAGIHVLVHVTFVYFMNTIQSYMNSF